MALALTSLIRLRRSGYLSISASEGPWLRLARMVAPNNNDRLRTDEDRMKLEGKVCLITGGSSGIGAATAREFAFRGADIAVCGLPADDALAQGVKREVEALNHRAVTITADVADPAEAVRCVRSWRDCRRSTWRCGCGRRRG